MRDHKALRKKAEERFGEKSSQSLEDLDSLSPEETRRMFHDLRVHQIELKMQNEELRTTQEALDASLARYVDLYEFAPVGYVTLNEQGLILEANLTAATLLGLSRSNLVKQPITGFILREDQDIYYWHRKQFFESGERQECELRMVKKDGATFWAQLDTIAVTNPTCGPVCSVMINNITIRKQAEVLLLEKKKLQGVLEMAGAICHELSQPLQVISGFSSTPASRSLISPNRNVQLSIPFFRQFFSASWTALSTISRPVILLAAPESQIGIVPVPL